MTVFENCRATCAWWDPYILHRSTKWGGSWSRGKDTFFLSYFFVLSPNMASIFHLHVRIFHKFEKRLFSKNYFFLKNYDVESISFNWHLFRNINLIYHDEMWKRRMYLASEIIFEFLLAYFIFFCDHFQHKHHFDFDIFYVYVYNGYCL